MSRKKNFQHNVGWSRQEEYGHRLSEKEFNEQMIVMPDAKSNLKPQVGPDRGWWWYRLLEKFDAL